jgi:tRNA splicing ligase
MKAYINYSEPGITIHRFDICDQAKVGPDEKIRHVLLNHGSLSKELDRFRNNKHRFADEPYMNDMWLIFDLEDPEFEMALLIHIKKLIGLTNSTINTCTIEEHC